MPGVDSILKSIRIFNEKKNQAREALDQNGKVSQLKAGEKYIYHVQLYVRDYSNMTSN